jgi:hypothetical protein
MGSRTQLIEALQIAEKYDADGWTESDHDVIFLMPLGTNVSEEDVKRLEDLGCHVSEEYDCWAMFV